MVSLETSYIKDGNIYCKFKREVKTVVNNREFDMANNAYYLLLATGSEASSKYYIY